ncbi:MAG: hypothetical protein ACFWTS_07950 [Pseudoclavibacter caeni]|jgi:hypothetical protein
MCGRATGARQPSDRTPREMKEEGTNAESSTIVPSGLVDLSERCGNRRRVVERLIAAWKRGVGEVRSPVDPIVFAESEAVTEPRRRSRTPLTEQEVDAMRTARSNGVSVSTVAKQFTVHRGTVWAKTHY